jgi:hypothetical protein
MGKFVFGGSFFLALACAACGTSTTGGGSTDPFVGKWACSDGVSITITSPPGYPAQNSTEMSTLNIISSSGVLTASAESDSGTNCNLSFTSSGSTATLKDGQSCTSSEGLTLTYKSGSATVSGSSMNSTLSFDANGNIMMVPVMATGTQTSTCSRLSAPPSGGTTTGGW